MSALLCDLKRAYIFSEGGRIRRLFGCARAPGVHAVIVLRFGQWCKVVPWPLRLPLDIGYFFLNGLIKILWGIELPRGAAVGPGLFIAHFGGIVVSPHAKIGRNCNISQGVTIGVSGKGEKFGAPTIGDGVFIAVGACVIGKIRIGNNVKIGANAVIHKDLPDNAIAVLDPGFRIISLAGNQAGPAS